MLLTLEVVVAADAVDKKRVKNKIRVADAKDSEFSFLLVIIYLTPSSLFTPIFFAYVWFFKSSMIGQLTKKDLFERETSIQKIRQKNIK